MLLALWLFSAALFGWLWHGWGRTGFPVGSFWWDELALSGAVAAMRQGLAPITDFWAPFVLPLEVKYWAQAWAGLRSGPVLECILQGASVLGMLTWLMWGQRPTAGWTAVAMLAVAQATLPFNVGSLLDAAPGLVAFAGGYNRWGGALLTVGILSLAVPAPGPKQWGRVFWLSVLLAVCLLVKVTAFQVLVVMLALAAFLRASRAGHRLWVISLMGSLLLVGGYLLARGQLLEHLRTLKELGAIRWELSLKRWPYFMDTLPGHRQELWMLVGTVVSLWLAGNAKSVVLKQTLWCVSGGGMVMAYTFSNFGDNGLAPCLAVIYVVTLEAFPSLGSSLALLRTATSPAVSAWAACLAWSLCMAQGGLQAGNLFWQAWDLSAHQASTDWSPLPVGHPSLSALQLIDTASWSGRPSPHALMASPSIWRVETHAAYIEALDDALGMLDRLHLPGSASVYALDYPALAFVALGGYRAPKQVLPWLLYGHELSWAHHPDIARQLSDVDVLLRSKCSLSEGNRQHLWAMYAPYVDQAWRLVAQSPCWDVWTHSRLRQGGLSSPWTARPISPMPMPKQAATGAHMKTQ